MSDVRRLQLSFLVSIVVNGLVLLLAAHLWNLTPLTFPTPTPRIKLVQIMLPPPKPMPVQKALPVQDAVLKPHPIKPPKPQKRRPGARVKSSSPAPAAKPAGGSDAGAAAPAQAAPPAIPVLTTERPSPLVAPLLKAPPPPIEIPTPSLTPSRIVAPPVPKAVAAVQTTAHGSAGTDTRGIGKGAGEGSGAGAGAGSGTSRDAGEPFGIGKGLAGDGGPRHVVYVLDISRSMVSRLSRAVSEIRKALSGLRPDETFNIMAFSDDVKSFDTDMVPATPSMVQKASAFLATLQVDDGTNTQAAMAAALSATNVNEVVLLTDGVPGLGITDPDSLADYIQHCNKNHARISCVGMVGVDQNGVDQTFEATELLQRIARDSGGACKLVPLGYASP